jgi:hypothetical protein
VEVMGCFYSLEAIQLIFSNFLVVSIYIVINAVTIPDTT